MITTAKRSQLILILLSAVCVAVTALSPLPVKAQTSQPSIQPGSPKAAILDYDKALLAGNGPVIRELLLTTNPTEERVAKSIVDTNVVMADMMKKTIAKFGADASHEAFGDPAQAVGQADENVGRATETVTGDTATVVANAGPQGTMTLKKVDGKWKISVAGMLKNASPENVEKTLDGVDKANATIKRLADEVEAGKYSSADAAKTAWNERIAPVKAAMQPTGPTTNPT